jgi:hypothetical protein
MEQIEQLLAHDLARLTPASEQGQQQQQGQQPAEAAAGALAPYLTSLQDIFATITSLFQPGPAVISSHAITMGTGRPCEHHKQAMQQQQQQQQQQQLGMDDWLELQFEEEFGGQVQGEQVLVLTEVADREMVQEEAAEDAAAFLEYTDLDNAEVAQGGHGSAGGPLGQQQAARQPGQAQQGGGGGGGGGGQQELLGFWGQYVALAGSETPEALDAEYEGAEDGSLDPGYGYEAGLEGESDADAVDEELLAMAVHLAMQHIDDGSIGAEDLPGALPDHPSEHSLGGLMAAAEAGSGWEAGASTSGGQAAGSMASMARQPMMALVRQAAAAMRQADQGRLAGLQQHNAQAQAVTRRRQLRQAHDPAAAAATSAAASSGAQGSGAAAEALAQHALQVFARLQLVDLDLLQARKALVEQELRHALQQSRPTGLRDVIKQTLQVGSKSALLAGGLHGASPSRSPAAPGSDVPGTVARMSHPPAGAGAGC